MPSRSISARTARSASKLPWISEMNAVFIKHPLVHVSNRPASPDSGLAWYLVLQKIVHGHRALIVSKGGPNRRGGGDPWVDLQQFQSIRASPKLKIRRTERPEAAAQFENCVREFARGNHFGLFSKSVPGQKAFERHGGLITAEAIAERRRCVFFVIASHNRLGHQDVTD